MASTGTRRPPRHRALLADVTRRRAIEVMAALGTHDLVYFLVHELGGHAEPDTDAQRQQPLLRGTDEFAERLLHTRGSPASGAVTACAADTVFMAVPPWIFGQSPRTLPTGADAAKGLPSDEVLRLRDSLARRSSACPSTCSAWRGSKPAWPAAAPRAERFAARHLLRRAHRRTGLEDAAGFDLADQGRDVPACSPRSVIAGSAARNQKPWASSVGVRSGRSRRSQRVESEGTP